MRSETPSIPSSGPPSFVGLVVFEFPSQEHSNEDLMKGTLDKDDGD
jgi:hypothetical protein